MQVLFFILGCHLAVINLLSLHCVNFSTEKRSGEITYCLLFLKRG